MTLGRLVRWALALDVLFWLLAFLALYLIRVWSEDPRPMVLEIEPAFGQDVTYRLRAEIDNPSEKPLIPRIRFEGVDTQQQVTIRPGEVARIPLRLEVPGGIWAILNGKIKRGDVSGWVFVEPVEPAPPEAVPRSVPVQLSLPTIWETYWPMLIVSVVAAVVVVFLWLAAQVLARPSGRLELVQGPQRRPYEDTTGRARVYNLSDSKYKRRFLFWMRDLLLVNTRLLRQISIDLREAVEVGPFVLQFTYVGVTISCPRGEIVVRTLGPSDTKKYVVDLGRFAEWRNRSLKKSKEELATLETEDRDQQDHVEEGEDLTALPGAPTSQEDPEEETQVEEDRELYDFVPLHDGGEIVVDEKHEIYIVYYEAIEADNLG